MSKVIAGSKGLSFRVENSWIHNFGMTKDGRLKARYNAKRTETDLRDYYYTGETETIRSIVKTLGAWGEGKGFSAEFIKLVMNNPALTPAEK